MNIESSPTPKVVECHCVRPPRGSPEKRDGKAVVFQRIYLPVSARESMTWVVEMQCRYMHDCWFCPHKERR